MILKKLPKQAKNRLQVYLTNDELDCVIDLKKQFGINTTGKMLRFMICYVIESNDKSNDFKRFINQYIELTEKVREKNVTDTVLNAYPRVKNEMANAIEILEGNELIGDKKNH